MTFQELDAQMIGRNRLRKRISSTLGAVRIDDHTIRIDRLFRQRAYLLAQFSRDGKLKVLCQNENLCDWPFIESVNKIFPPRTYRLVQPYPHQAPFWIVNKNSDPSRFGGWTQVADVVHIPARTGDMLDVDAKYLHAQLATAV